MKRLFVSLCVGLLSAGLPVAAMATFAVDGGVNDDDGVVNGVVTISTDKFIPLIVPLHDQTGSDFHIVSGGRLVLVSDLVFTACWIQFANLTIDAGGAIEFDEEGYPSDEGPGSGYSSPTGDSGSGAGHGGVGGHGSTTTMRGQTYDTEMYPNDYGSGGGSAGMAPGGSGGGLVLLEVQGQLTMNGFISADGGDGTVAGMNASGGGSGGAIQILTNIMAGTTGVFSVRGGDGGTSATTSGGGGGGGRIHIRCEENLSTYHNNPSAFVIDGGSASIPAEDGHDGAYVFQDRGSVPLERTSWGRIRALFR